MDNAPEENYSTKDFGIDVAKEVGKVVAAEAIAITTLCAIGYTIVKVTEFRAKRRAKKTAIEA